MIQANYLKTIYTRTAPYVTPSMLSADYWVKKQKKPDQIILSLDAILQKNEKIKEQISFSHQSASIHRYGICCSESGMYYCPSDNLSVNEEDPYSDQNRFSSILVNEPVWILGISEDKRWFHIRTYYGTGWTICTAIAECRSRQEWQSAQDTGTFPLVVTAGRLYLLPERTCPQKRTLSYSMGTCLHLIPALQAPATIDERFYFDNYVVRVPARDPNGFLSWEYKLIPVSEDVHAGFLTYTPKNLLQQMFKLHGTIYGWGDMYQSHDCSSYAMAVYRCFGFSLARDSSDQAQMPFPAHELLNMSDSEKKAVFRSALPGSILWFDGHITLYLGHEQDRYYGISAAEKCMPRKGDPVVSTGTAFLCELSSICRKNGQSWIAEMQRLLELK